MKKDNRFKRWSVSNGDLSDITPAKARELLTCCFFEAQKETILRARKQLGVRSSDDDIYSSVVDGVRGAFKESGEDFENPTKESLQKVLEILVGKSTSWGTPQDIIEHHKAQIKKILEKL